ncbi:MAG: hypothetical protein AUJ92_22155 [Armatimonadetes bacterium CG2_30_59_28]|nr:UDP-N-acetylmuramoyl-tripeptide--D-alanyl-D-alanine ligase [Armatimonadota bacterium]OIO89181.1 MAG: hypothetical protein AUJ92_22155 [Armatimonadetes bacterium CG2_30_59_28]PIY42669.1 MAG: UDP-N-acetylmuramoyl-tripeptide--D-alanyl-D-alanine ligase [Armatimonadetes bacterium CG_4_10_14_3_um_filter_59_10]
MFTLEEILQATKGTLAHGGLSTEFTGVSTDSRTTPAGGLFVALRGERFDGHDYVEQAAKSGAAGVVVERGRGGLSGAVTAVEVANTLTALAEIASFHRGRFALPVVAVTGSVGKTTTKEFVAAALSPRHYVLKSRESFNNEIGLPLTLLQLNEQHDVVVLELAMRGEGQIRYLTEIASPTVGVITNIGESHLGILGSVQAIARAKGELVENMAKEGVAVLNADDGWYTYLSELSRCPVVSFGCTDAADFSAREVRLSCVREQTGALSVATEFTVVGHASETCSVRLPVGGHHYVSNALAATAVAASTGMRLEEIAAGLGSIQPPKMRQQWLTAPDGYLILDDAYNSSPASLRAALRAIQWVSATGKRIAVLGDIKELGEQATEIHRQLGTELHPCGIDVLIATGDFADSLARGARTGGMSDENVLLFHSTDAVTEAVRQRVKRDDVVLVKASRAMHLERVVDGLMEGGDGH